MFNFIEFTGEETEKEFLEKCLKQWEITSGGESQIMQKMMELGTVFFEMRHRIEELD